MFIEAPEYCGYGNVLTSLSTDMVREHRAAIVCMLRGWLLLLHAVATRCSKHKLRVSAAAVHSLSLSPRVYGFSVIFTDCISYYSSIHEIGHNMGLQHDAASSSPGMTPWAYGV
eukprot:4887-Heterococcus_DN1.PRE.3